MIKKLGRYILKRSYFLIPESVLIRHIDGVLDKKDTSFTTSIIRNCFSERYRNANPEKKKQLGILVWSSKAATQYFQGRIPPETIVAQFLSVIQKNTDFTICEIGTGNGNLINTLSERSLNEKFVGVDLSDEQIKINQATYNNNVKLKFICADILEYIKINNDPTLYISYVSLTTFTPEMIMKLFQHIAQNTNSSVLAIYEPIESNTANSQQSTIRSGLAYAHNYITIAKQAGLTVAEQTSHSPFIWLVFKN